MRNFQIPVRVQRAPDGSIDQEHFTERCRVLTEAIDSRVGALSFLMTDETTPDDVVRGGFVKAEAPRVLVGMCSSDWIFRRTAFDLVGAVCIAREGGLEAIPTNAAGSNYELNLNRLAQACFEHKCAALALLDSDVTFPQDVLLDLWNHDKDVIGASYCQREEGGALHGHELGDEPLDPHNKEVRKVARLPGGALLIRAAVLEAVFNLHGDGSVFRKQGATGSADYQFCDDARRAGFDVWYDPSLKFGHWGIKEFSI